ncbi:hypothetical protein TNCT_317441 [Trichonephila clavata]|uniref:Uncharacterized protein n=1 Tax=Trichonephila clavata TaxID=2740835 RepID=A0A8X6KAD8_TRICU|nr:hypothetical protein TNCT_317441 [Trichonephila clavata]
MQKKPYLHDTITVQKDESTPFQIIIAYAVISFVQSYFSGDLFQPVFQWQISQTLVRRLWHLIARLLAIDFAFWKAVNDFLLLTGKIS